MIALTLWPEWAWAIANGQNWPDGLVRKLVENREWHPGRRLPVGARLAIHAGKSLGGRPGADAADDAADAVLGMYRRANPGTPLPRANNHECVGLDSPGFRERLQACPKSAIVAVVTIAGYDQDERTGWDVPGAWHWRLRDVEVLTTPVPCRGAQGLWTVPDDVLVQLREACGCSK